MERIFLSEKPADITSFDVIGKKFANTLENLVPGTEVVIFYYKSKDINKLDKAKETFIESQIWNYSEEIPLPTHKEWKKGILLHLRRNKQIKSFLYNSYGYFSNLKDIAPTFKACIEESKKWQEIEAKELSTKVIQACIKEIPLRLVSTAIAYLWKRIIFAKKGNLEPLIETIYQTLNFFEILSTQKVEGENLTHCILLAKGRRGSPQKKEISYPSDFENLKQRLAQVCEGEERVLWVSPKGHLIRTISLKIPKEIVLPQDDKYPRKLQLLSAISRKYKGVSIALMKDKTIPVFINGKYVFLKRAGKWRGMIWHLLSDGIFDKYGKSAQTLFKAALSLSTIGHGGILGLVKSKGKVKCVEKTDLIEEAYSIDLSSFEEIKKDEESSKLLLSNWSKKILNSSLPILGNENNFVMNAHSLATLAKIDGATLVCEDGKLLAYGAILSEPNKLLLLLNFDPREELNQEEIPSVLRENLFNNSSEEYKEKIEKIFCIRDMENSLLENAEIKAMPEEQEWKIVFKKKKVLMKYHKPLCVFTDGQGEGLETTFHLFSIERDESFLGARTRAGKQLSSEPEVKFVIKVSEDGPITFFRDGVEVIEL